MNTVSSNNLKDWSVKEWDAWIHKEFIPLINEEFDNQIEIYVWKYKGVKFSIGAYYPHCLSNGINKPLIEFMFLNSDMITANLHVETESANYSWSNEYRTEEFKNKFNKLYSAGLLPSFKVKEGKRSFGCLRKNIEKDNLDLIAKIMIEIIREFYEFFSKFN